MQRLMSCLKISYTRNAQNFSYLRRRASGYRLVFRCVEVRKVRFNTRLGISVMSGSIYQHRYCVSQNLSNNLPTLMAARMKNSFLHFFFFVLHYSYIYGISLIVVNFTGLKFYQISQIAETPIGQKISNKPRS